VTPKEISVAPPSSPSKNVTQGLIEVQPRQKSKALLTLLEQEEVKNAFVFCNRKRDIDGVKRALDKAGFKAGQLHGDMPQSARTETLRKFKADEINILVCSDVAARGLDIKGLSHVFNMDVPFNAEDYVHRIGRTGRAGMSGRAFTFALPDESKYVEAIEKLIENAIPRIALDGSEPAEAEAKPEPKARDSKPRTRSNRRSKSEEAEAAPKPKQEPRQEKVEKAADKPERRPSSQPERSAEKRGNRGRRYNSQHDIMVEEGGDDVIGFGDNIPAFLR
jgi:superfamily II DNA/RNA helicase